MMTFEEAIERLTKIIILTKLLSDKLPNPIIDELIISLKIIEQRYIVSLAVDSKNNLDESYKTGKW